VKMKDPKLQAESDQFDDSKLHLEIGDKDYPSQSWTRFICQFQVPSFQRVAISPWYLTLLLWPSNGFLSRIMSELVQQLPEYQETFGKRARKNHTFRWNIALFHGYRWLLQPGPLSMWAWLGSCLYIHYHLRMRFFSSIEGLGELMKLSLQVLAFGIATSTYT